MIMKNLRKITIISTSLICAFYISVSSQTKVVVPKVGNPLPSFKFNEMENYDKPVAEHSDFKGKWLILDFFTATCGTCFASLPKVNKIQQELKEDLKIVMVGDNGGKYGKNIRNNYNRVSQREKLNLSVAYDSTLFKQWNIWSVPYIIIVDESGVVRAISSSQDLNLDNIKRLMKNRHNNSDFRDINYESWDINRPFLTNGNGGADTAFLYRSLISEWKRPTSIYPPVSISKYNETIEAKGFQASGVPLTALFMWAYLDRGRFHYGDSLYGKTLSYPILKDVDSSLFILDEKKENYFNYSLVVPKEKSNTENVMRIMQNDLKNYFGVVGYFEMRKMPYWSLTATNEAKQKLKSKGDKFYNKKLLNTGFEFRDYPIRTAIDRFSNRDVTDPPIIDETGINYNIDLAIDARLSDFNAVKEELKKNGLELILREKEMKVLVLKIDKN